MKKSMKMPMKKTVDSPKEERAERKIPPKKMTPKPKSKKY